MGRGQGRAGEVVALAMRQRSKRLEEAQGRDGGRGLGGQHGEALVCVSVQPGFTDVCVGEACVRWVVCAGVVGG